MNYDEIGEGIEILLTGDCQVQDVSTDTRCSNARRGRVLVSLGSGCTAAFRCLSGRKLPSFGKPDGIRHGSHVGDRLTVDHADMPPPLGPYVPMDAPIPREPHKFEAEAW